MAVWSGVSGTMAEPAVPHVPSFDACFGCAPDRGLRVRVAGGRASFDSRYEVTVGHEHQGAPGLAHGGMLAGVLDEAIGMAVWSLGGSYATARLEVDYLAPVPIGTRLHIDVRRTAVEGRKVHAEAEARLGEDSPAAVRAVALYVRTGPSS